MPSWRRGGQTAIWTRHQRLPSTCGPRIPCQLSPRPSRPGSWAAFILAWPLPERPGPRSTSILLVSRNHQHSVEGARGCCLEGGLISMGHLLSADSFLSATFPVPPTIARRATASAPSGQAQSPSLLSCTGSRGNLHLEVSVPPTGETVCCFLGDLSGAWNEIVVGSAGSGKVQK